MMQVIIDADLLIDHYLLKLEEIEYLEDIIENQKCEFFITQYGLEKFILLAGIIYSPEVANKYLSAIHNKITVCPVNYEISEQAKSLFLKNFESALEVACAVSMGVSAILTHNPQDFDGVNFPIWLVEDFLTPLHLEESLHLALGVAWIENICLSNLDTPSFYPLEVVDVMNYRIRNSITTVMEFFVILKQEGCQYIFCGELAKKYKYSESKINNILLDLQTFEMVKLQSGKISIQKELINADNIFIANYLAKFLNQHIVVQKLYKQLKPNENFGREYLKNLIREVYPENKYKKSKPLKNTLPLLFDIYPDSIATKSASDYVSRMLGWLLFTGILEKRSKEIIARPAKVSGGKQKGKLLEENANQLIDVDKSIKQLDLFQS
ncbi:hypothetical protein [Trichormus variabilis]|uniref:PIN domain-containing protein n=1 Tax=Trichormus variabilis SAG 1403-4b TaxID=447716 RepID=A0A3S1ADB3_ANAVA|nr:hypothetical protein [Trichormus variabilis]MBD2626068.1 hypothetical protein [Trichormus variabilis FACHB-164]RUS98317.1 hypothetical protein DSM107003_14050 [Trichormus variabilis SAG 1403-4b]